MLHEFSVLVRGALEGGLPNTDCIPPAFSSPRHHADVGLLIEFEITSARQCHLPGANAGLWR